MNFSQWIIGGGYGGHRGGYGGYGKTRPNFILIIGQNRQSK